jgi:carboxylesterase type B
MVFIYGGAFDGGSSSISQLNGAGLTDQEDVVTVTFK